MKKLIPLFFGLALFVPFQASALDLFFWDVNGSEPGCGSATPTGTWGVDAYWNKDDPDGTGSAGTNPTEAWPAGNFAVFAAGDDATGAYTVFVKGNVQVGDIHVDLGEVTFDPDPTDGGTLVLMDGDSNRTNRLLSVGHKTANCVARYNVPITTAEGITRYKRGTLIFGATNTYTGPTKIEGGTIQIAVPHAIPADSALILANNDTARVDFSWDWQYTPAVFHTGGHSQQLGVLRLEGIDFSVLRVLDFGDGASALSFANSSAEDWLFQTLTVTNFSPGVDTLRFGTDGTGLTADQLSQIQFAGFGGLPAVIDAQGYVTPALPRLTHIERTANDVQLTWTAIAGRTYRVQYKPSLAPGVWSDLTPDITASGDTASLTHSGASSAEGFYRVEILP